MKVANFFLVAVLPLATIAIDTSISPYAVDNTCNPTDGACCMINFNEAMCGDQSQGVYQHVAVIRPTGCTNLAYPLSTAWIDVCTDEVFVAIFAGSNCTGGMENIRPLIFFENQCVKPGWMINSVYTFRRIGAWGKERAVGDLREINSILANADVALPDTPAHANLNIQGMSDSGT